MGSAAKPQSPGLDQLTLCGCAETITRFFTVCIHSILFQRQIYPVTDFRILEIWGTHQMISNNSDVLDHINVAMAQVGHWLKKGLISRLALVLVDAQDTAVERWDFHISDRDRNQAQAQATCFGAPDFFAEESLDAAEHSSLKAVLRQIAMSVTFLPVLYGHHTFHIAVVEHTSTQAPHLWRDANDRVVANAEEVGFSAAETGPFKIDSLVQYQLASN